MEDISLGLLLRGGWMLPLSICHADMPADLFSGTKQCQFRIPGFIRHRLSASPFEIVRLAAHVFNR